MQGRSAVPRLGAASSLRWYSSTMSVSRTKIRVRYAETDQMGVVYYANYFVWFEIGRVELLRQIGFDYKLMETEDDCCIAVVNASCKYKAPARYDDELLVETRVLAVRRSVLKFSYRVLRAERSAQEAFQVLAEGETTHVVVDSQMRKTVMPEKYLVALEPFLAGSADA
jgi:acyl-CoA thioester hydrolase